MSNKKLSELTETPAVTSADEFYVNNDGVSNKITAANLSTSVASLLGITAYILTLLDDVDAEEARATLGVVIGTDVQAFGSYLDATDIGVTVEAFDATILKDADIGSTVQAYDATLESISALGTAGDRLAYTTGVDTWAEATVTLQGRQLIDDASFSAMRTTLGLGTAAVVNTGVANGNVPVMDAIGYPAADGSRITGISGGGGAVTAYDFTDATDVAINTVTPSGSPWSSSQSITIPTKGVIKLNVHARADNASGANAKYCFGLRINGVDYWPSIDDNGTINYGNSGAVTTAEYRTFYGAVSQSSAPAALDIEGRGIATGLQTVQPIASSTTATATQTLKGTLVTSRLHVEIVDRS